MALKSVPDQNVADRVTVELREAIFSGDLAPGERLVERKPPNASARATSRCARH